MKSEKVEFDGAFGDRLSGRLDQTVGIKNAAHIYKKAKHPKSFFITRQPLVSGS